MLHTVPEVADIIHITKQSLYSKLKLPLYSDKVTTKHGQAYIDDDLVMLIKDNMKTPIKVTSNATVEPIKQLENPEDILIDKDILIMNQKLINDLLTQLKEKDLQFNNQLNAKDLQFNNQLNAKDLQLNNLNERLKQEQELNKNSQILLRETPKQDILLLEEHFQDLDTKLEEVKENMQQRKNNQKPKGFFSKIFRGSDEDL